MAVHSKRSYEGELRIDNRVSGGTLRETPTITCSHCGDIVVINPDRTRARGYCPKCDHYVCDRCEGIRVSSGGACRTLKQVIDEIRNGAEHQTPADAPL